MKIKQFSAISAILLAIASLSLAQNQPQFSAAEKTAITFWESKKQDAQKQYNEAEQQEMQFAQEFTASHPGFHVNLQTFAIEPDAPKVKDHSKSEATPKKN